jgi:hypothetical protein
MPGANLSPKGLATAAATLFSELLLHGQSVQGPLQAALADGATRATLVALSRIHPQEQRRCRP